MPMRALLPVLALASGCAPAPIVSSASGRSVEEPSPSSVAAADSASVVPDASPDGMRDSARPDARASLDFLVGLARFAAGEHDVDALVDELGRVAKRDKDVLELVPNADQFREIRVRVFRDRVSEIEVSLTDAIIGDELIRAFGPFHAVTVGDFWDDWRIYEVDVETGGSYLVTVQTDQLPLDTTLADARLTKLTLFRRPRDANATSLP